MTGGGAMQFVPPLFFSRPGKGRAAGGGVSPGCMDGAGWRAVDRGSGKKCAVAVKKNRERVCRYSQKYYLCTAIATIAQSVEHFIRNEKVPGSSPGRGSAKRFKFLEPLFFMALEKEVPPRFFRGAENRWGFAGVWLLPPPQFRPCGLVGETRKEDSILKKQLLDF